MKRIKYEDIVKRISFIEKRKIKNEEKIKFLIEENNTLSSNLKLLNQKKNVRKNESGSSRSYT